ncbi:MAG: peptidylprolyl isomerase [Patescibacteria group bacterium]
MTNNKQKKNPTDSELEKKDNALRSGVLNEIGKYHYGEHASGIKRFVRSEPRKIVVKDNTTIKKKETEVLPDVKLELSNLATNEEPLTKDKVVKHLNWKIWLSIVLGSLVLLLVVFLTAVYSFRIDKKIPDFVYSLPLPLAYVNGSMLSLSEFNSEVMTLQKYYDRIIAENGSSETISLNEIENVVLERMIREQIVSDFAQRNNIVVTNEQVNSELSVIITDFGTEDSLKEFIIANYNWSLDDFKNKIIVPYLQREQVTAWFVDNQSVQIAAQDNALKVKNDISNGIITFAEAARKYSDDLVSAAQEGSLSVFTWGTMIPEFEDAVRMLAVGEISDPVKTQFGWHIIRRDSLPADTTDAENYASASHILIRDFNFDKWLESEREKSKPLIFLKIDNNKN